MHVLVTGGAGYIGSCVVEELLAGRHEVRVLDSFLWGREPLEKVEEKLEIIDGDVRDIRVLCNALQGVEAAPAIQCHKRGYVACGAATDPAVFCR